MLKLLRAYTSNVHVNQHAKWWLIYFLIGYMINTLSGKPPHPAGFAAVFPLFAFFFYGITHIHGLNNRWNRLHKALCTVALSIAVVYLFHLLVYRILPAFGVIMYNADKEFHIGRFIQYVVNNFSYVALGAVAYVTFQKAMVSERKKIETDRQLLETERRLLQTERQQMALQRLKEEMEQENRLYERLLLTSISNSHWLKNVLNNVYGGLIHMDEESNAVLLIINIYKYMLEHLQHTNSMVSGQVEIDLLRTMSALNEFGNPGCQPINWQIDKNLRWFEIPPLTFASLLENAFVHGDQYDPACPIGIQISGKPDRITFVCCNKTKDAASAAVSTGLGLKNTQRRLELAGINANLHAHSDIVAQRFEVTLIIYTTANA